MITNVISGKLSDEITNKRELRLAEALKIQTGTAENKTFYKVCEADGLDVYFLKPGKEYFRGIGKNNINDMTPCVGKNGENIFERYSFGDIWNDLLKLSFVLKEDNYKQLFVLIYRLAFLLDFKVIDGFVRFSPSREVVDVISSIQEDADSKKQEINILQFLMFLDLLAWNEDVKYQISKAKPGKKPNRNNGRINNLLSMISIPLIFRDLVTNIPDEKIDPEKIDFAAVIDIAQQFSRTRGVTPIPNKELVKRLSPYLQ